MKMPVDELTIGNEMIISKMGIGEMAVDEMFACENVWQ
jgi:hypothetical protein